MVSVDQLGISPDAVEDFVEHFQQWTYEGHDYRLLPKARSGIERGTVLIGETVVRGFPSIPRILVLGEGVPAFFDEPFVIEEKLNGYNVRVVRVDGTLFAFTRGGFICPFTTAKVERSIALSPFFDDNPTVMLCGEMVGPRNPYTTYDYPGISDVAFRVFDIRDRVTGRPVSVADRRRLCSEYDIPQTTLFGRYDPTETEAVSALLNNLDARGREGVVMKSLDGRNLLKYTTPATHRDNLAYAFSLPFDTGRDFMFPRLVRDAFQAVEWNEPTAAIERRAHELGEAILLPMVETIQRVNTGEFAGEEHTIRDDADVIDATLSHLDSLGMTLDITDDRTVDGERLVTFTKRATSTTDKITHYLDGGRVVE
ncbi:RNA ligase [Haladaptatus sp. DFWS20]|uniref:RNA ligase n=1 Tax=Haladaptatus sp. DFWS20 TaxID=3403467 RepID=UPI003EBCEC6D